MSWKTMRTMFYTHAKRRRRRRQFLLAIKKGRAARSALIASTMHRSSRQASRAAVMKAVAADLIREQRRVISEVVRVPHGDLMARGGIPPAFLFDRVKKLARSLLTRLDRF